MNLFNPVLYLATVMLMLACASGSRHWREQEQCVCEDTPIQNSVSMLTLISLPPIEQVNEHGNVTRTIRGPHFDAPEICDKPLPSDNPGKEEGAYIAVHGHGTFPFLFRREGVDRSCHEPPPHAYGEMPCEGIFADAFAKSVFQKMEAAGIKGTGIGVGACGYINHEETEYRLDQSTSFRYSISINDWQHVNKSLEIMHEEMLIWSAKGTMGLSVKPISCACPERRLGE